MGRRIPTLVLTAAAVIRPAAAIVYKCTDEHGDVTYTDRGCQASEVTEKPEIAVSVVATKRLTTAEQGTLDAIAVRQQRFHVEAEKRRRRAGAERQRTHEKQRQECAKAEAGLEALELTRRRGYAMADAERLAGQERRLRRQRDENCRN